ncbi:mitogen-activated protein kinase kinase kinase 1-like isoform X1 [Salvia hispanica]|uniref:mitogen-activated protein kinase kinase kinase 1-like isoform X1 n=1 Tax=Salvia hispanica TaxID=49212 RepID=UPI0020095A54|nr:mitogen-activated protein kinase kinase kinase 1-like isoform X1 [Salvia hispanica]
MHRLPKIFASSSERRRSDSDSISGGSSSSSRRAAGSKPRLERRNARKNIDYDYSPSSASAPSSSSSSYYTASEESARTRSLDLYGGRRSFRVEGVDGEIEIMCKNLGFSGVDDFSISPDEYEVMKVRSSSAPVRFSQPLEKVSDGAVEVSGDFVVAGLPNRGIGVSDSLIRCSGNSGEVISEDSEGIRDFRDKANVFGSAMVDTVRVSDGVPIEKVSDGAVEVSGDVEVAGLPNRGIGVSDSLIRCSDHSGGVISENSEGIRDFRDKANIFGSAMVDIVRVSDGVSNDSLSTRSNEFRGSGIKGVRPPFLGLLAPPPFMSLPVIDQDCSTWDIFRNFGPDNGRLQALDEQGGLGRTEDAVEEDERRRRMAREENFVLSAPCSFTASSNDDDSSSTTTDPVSSVSPNGGFRRVISSWQKGDLLGSGSFGSVYEGIADDGVFFAIKEVSLLDQGEEGKQRIAQLEQEIALLRKFKHENIVQYYGTEKDDSRLYIFLELVVKGSLLSLYQKYTLRDSVVSAYTRQILHGLKYLHDQGVVHRDIKCANILVHTNGLVKLADFGLAKATKLNDVKSCKGTAFWMAPEVVRSEGYGLAADIWSLGCTVLEMLTRRFPYGDMECMPAMYRIGKGERPPIPDSLSSDARDFLLKCLQADPSVRSTAAELLNHPFVKQPLPVPLGFASPNPFTG